VFFERARLLGKGPAAPRATVMIPVGGDGSLGSAGPSAASGAFLMAELPDEWRVGDDGSSAPNWVAALRRSRSGH
jgi:hypothetical protein